MIDIVIVNWNSGAQLSECLSSIERYNYKLVNKVFVIDNNSSDGSMNCCLSRFRLPLEVIQNKENMGFSRACNQGAWLGKAPYILFLNPDTRLFENSLTRPLLFMEKKENINIGICGIQLIGEQGNITQTCARFPSIGRFLFQTIGVDKLASSRSTGVHMRDWDHKENKFVDHVIGAFFLVRRKLFTELNGFDERFFVYLEDLDFSFRTSNAHYHSIYFSDAQAYHAGGGTSRQVIADRLFYSLESRILYGFKHFHYFHAYILVIATMVAEPFSRILLALLQRDFYKIVNIINGYRRLWLALPRVITSNKKH